MQPQLLGTSPLAVPASGVPDSLSSHWSPVLWLSSEVVVLLLDVCVCVLEAERLDVVGDVADAAVKLLRPRRQRRVVIPAGRESHVSTVPKLDRVETEGAPITDNEQTDILSLVSDWSDLIRCDIDTDPLMAVADVLLMLRLIRPKLSVRIPPSRIPMLSRKLSKTPMSLSGMNGRMPDTQKPTEEEHMEE